MNGWVRSHVCEERIIVCGSTLEEHNELTKAPQAVRKNGLKHDEDKCHFRDRDVPFLGGFVHSRRNSS